MEPILKDAISLTELVILTVNVLALRLAVRDIKTIVACLHQIKLSLGEGKEN